ncbi:hypothetical protein GCM10007424_08400 [Flavobacterium suaedae]|uniref:Uncharacterized protein n=1 Tax=Flavobacterium suaedae TaxID=1767027 RepID=A0ABQ1JKR5_9FLAO|nr:hypothetical protein GCM10007424_08400 [Flavobacterium suaedae]
MPFFKPLFLSREECKVQQKRAKDVERYPALAFFIEVAISTNLSSKLIVQMYKTYFK